jgi:hypothetical protein
VYTTEVAGRAGHQLVGPVFDSCDTLSNDRF